MRLGDIIFSAKDPTQLLLVARMYEVQLPDKIVTCFAMVSSGTGKVYDVSESIVGLLDMRKIEL